ncbi:nucleic acid-binding, OB-fold protein [Tanacetum coccineum]
MQKEDLMSKPEQFRSKIVEGRIKKRLDELALVEQAYIKNDKVVVKDYIKSTIATIGENIKVKRFVRFNLGEGLENKTQDFNAEVAAQTTAKKAPAPTTEPQTAATEPVTVDEYDGLQKGSFRITEDIEKHKNISERKGLSTATKNRCYSRRGRIGSYIHDSRIGVLIEVNCETDFVGRSEKFKELVDDMAMQVVACPKVEYKGRLGREGRPKRLGELALLEQPFLKDDSVLVKDYVKQTVAAIGENIKVRRFIRFTLGESSESKSEESKS